MIDLITIKCIAGSGGNGCISFRREKFAPKGGPDGGDGGSGGAIYFVGDPSLNTLLHLKYQAIFKAGSGKHGGGNNKQGRTGIDTYVRVPLGTVISDISEDEDDVKLDILDDIPALVCQGGTGGRGNSRFTSATNQIPLLGEKGGEGEVRTLKIEMKLMGDVGIIGMPNAGKSTLVSVCSAAKPKIADYPFTTLQPVLGVVQRKYEDFLLVEIPGLIEGAHSGVGLGIDFLRHAERTRVLWHLVDGIDGDIITRIKSINNELTRFSTALSSKPQIVVINKMDVTEARENYEKYNKELCELGVPLFQISGVARVGLQPLINKTFEMLLEIPREIEHTQNKALEKSQSNIRRSTVQVSIVEGVYEIVSPRAERILGMINMKDPRVRLQFWRELVKLGVDKALVKAGVQPGDSVRMGKFELEWE